MTETISSYYAEHEGDQLDGTNKDRKDIYTKQEPPAQPVKVKKARKPPTPKPALKYKSSKNARLMASLWESFISKNEGLDLSPEQDQALADAMIIDLQVLESVTDAKHAVSFQRNLAMVKDELTGGWGIKQGSVRLADGRTVSYCKKGRRNIARRIKAVIEQIKDKSLFQALDEWHFTNVAPVIAKRRVDNHDILSAAA